MIGPLLVVVVGLITLGKATNVFLVLRARQLGIGEAQIRLLWASLSAVAMLGSAPLFGWLMQGDGAAVALAVAASFALLAAGLMALIPLKRPRPGAIPAAGS